VVFTHDLDFSAILAQTAATRPSVIQVRYPKMRPEEFGPQLAAAIKENSAELAAGALLLIEPGRHRVRILPIAGH
jgi:predicted nuclease of predicted toxin-antitoxin system